MTNPIVKWIYEAKGHLAVVAFIAGTGWAIVKPHADDYIVMKIADQGLVSAERVGSIEKLLEEQTIRQLNMNRELNSLQTDREVARQQLQTLENLIKDQDRRSARDMREIRRLLLRAN